MTRRARLIGTGSYLPARVMTNADLPAHLETSDAWIRERTGITQRHLADANETTSDLAIAAARRALDAAGLTGADVDLIVLATATPDHTFPATAVKVQEAIGMQGGAAFDVQAVCSGFIYAITVADAMLLAGQGSTALVIGAETFSRILDWNDRGTCVLFGDGAGAVLLKAEDVAANGLATPGLISHRLRSDGRYHDLLFVDGGPSKTQSTGHLRMAGREVFRHAVANLADVVEEALAEHGLTVADLDWLVPHQANIRILEGTAKRLALPRDRVIITVDRHANTSAASVPLALDEAIRDGRIKTGDLVALEAMGGGFTWGASLLRL